MITKNVHRVNEYYLGKNRAVAVVDNNEHKCPILSDSDIVWLYNQKTLDFDDDQNEMVAGIKKAGYFLFSFGIEGGSRFERSQT